MIRAALFDFDGVVIHSEPVIKAAFTLSYQDTINGGEPPVNEYLSHMGDSFDNIMKKMGLPSTMYDAFSYYSNRLSNLIEVVPGMDEILQDLKSRDVKLALVTGKDRKRTLRILQKIGMATVFDALVCGDDVANPKPNPEPVLKALTMLGAGHTDALMIGDAANDLRAAHGAHVASCAVTWGTGTTDELRNERPDYMVQSPSELRDVLQGRVNTFA